MLVPAENARPPATELCSTLPQRRMSLSFVLFDENQYIAKVKITILSSPPRQFSRADMMCSCLCKLRPRKGENQDDEWRSTYLFANKTAHERLLLLYKEGNSSLLYTLRVSREVRAVRSTRQMLTLLSEARALSSWCSVLHGRTNRSVCALTRV